MRFGNLVKRVAVHRTLLGTLVSLVMIAALLFSRYPFIWGRFLSDSLYAHWVHFQAQYEAVGLGAWPQYMPFLTGGMHHAGLAKGSYSLLHLPLMWVMQLIDVWPPLAYQTLTVFRILLCGLAMYILLSGVCKRAWLVVVSVVLFTLSDSVIMYNYVMTLGLNMTGSVLAMAIMIRMVMDPMDTRQLVIFSAMYFCALLIQFTSPYLPGIFYLGLLSGVVYLAGISKWIRDRDYFRLVIFPACGVLALAVSWFVGLRTTVAYMFTTDRITDAMKKTDIAFGIFPVGGVQTPFEYVWKRLLFHDAFGGRTPKLWQGIHNSLEIAPIYFSSVWFVIGVAAIVGMALLTVCRMFRKVDPSGQGPVRVLMRREIHAYTMVGLSLVTVALISTDLGLTFLNGLMHVATVNHGRMAFFITFFLIGAIAVSIDRILDSLRAYRIKWHPTLLFALLMILLVEEIVWLDSRLIKEFIVPNFYRNPPYMIAGDMYGETLSGIQGPRNRFPTNELAATGVIQLDGYHSILPAWVHDIEVAHRTGPRRTKNLYFDDQFRHHWEEAGGFTSPDSLRRNTRFLTGRTIERMDWVEERREKEQTMAPLFKDPLLKTIETECLINKIVTRPDGLAITVRCQSEQPDESFYLPIGAFPFTKENAPLSLPKTSGVHQLYVW